MTTPPSSPETAVLGAFYKTVDVMKSARNSESKTMNVWADDMKAVEDVMFFLENLRDNAPAQRALPGLVSTLRSHADDCENEERWAVPELAPLLRRAADVIAAGVSPVTRPSGDGK